MANNKMLIDATHPEETRVVVLRDGRVEEFDYESAARKPLRGNIYLAKVTRVEPSLQAAFVEYGGNRHGFLAFNEIHPDYYQIPVADRQALLDEEAAAEAEEEAEADARAERRARGSRRGRNRDRHDDADREGNGHGAAPDDDETDSAASTDDADGHPAAAGAGAAEHHFEDGSEAARTDDDAPTGTQATAEGLSEPRRVAEPRGHDTAEDERGEAGGEPADAPHRIGLVEDVGVHEVENGSGNGEAEAVEEVGDSEDAMEEVPVRPRRRARSYKIQEVIKRRQIILVQVVKEERGNKGAALTTYLSLAGRYTVLMPNTGRGGGISRKITNPADRKRLKAIATELDVPDGMGLIIRTAGAARTKQEVKRDFEYLLRLWENVREMTLQSTAPNLVYEEGDLIKRSIRDHYTKDVDEILVAGEAAYHEARDFMGMLMPSHAKNVIDYREPEPLFTRFQIERQLNAMFSPFVTLRSGGYLVINQTEALVAVDVNSGKSTREFSIEETALNTNLEAADEIARQLKLRDLAGLIVVDFIDMEEKRNNRAVERRLKDALRFDRARIQVGRISHFGLMEMSRQRLRTGVLEGSTSQCPHCHGTGMIRSTESVALAVLRGLEDALMTGPTTSLIALTTAQVALYILNNKRAFINDMERRAGVAISVQASDKMQGATFSIERGAAPVQPQRRPERAAVNMDWGFDASDNEPPEDTAAASERRFDDEDAEEGREERDGDRRGGRGRRRRRRGRRGEADGVRAERPDDTGSDEATVRAESPEGADYYADAGGDAEGSPEMSGDAEGEAAPAHEGGEDDRRGRRRRRGRRGGRRGGRERLPGEAEGEGDGEGLAAGDDDPSRGIAEDVAARTPAIAGQGEQPDVEFYAVLPAEAAETGQPGRRQRRSFLQRPGRGRQSRPPIDGAAEARAAATAAAEMAIAAGSPEQQPQGETTASEPATHAAAPADAQPTAAAPAPARKATKTAPPAMPDAAVAATAASEPAAEQPAPAEPPRPRRSNGDPLAATPKIERVVVKPDESAPAPVEDEAAQKSTRKGWWQRKLGI